jgi:hypothetical protein
MYLSRAKARARSHPDMLARLAGKRKERERGEGGRLVHRLIARGAAPHCITMPAWKESSFLMVLNLIGHSFAPQAPSPPPEPPPLPPELPPQLPPKNPPTPPPIPFQQASAFTCSQLGWTFSPQLGVCGSSSTGIGGCLHNATWIEANRRCREHGARLCTRQELAINKNSGCGHDAELVWVWEQCGHPPESEFVCSGEDGICACSGTVFCKPNPNRTA